MAKRKAAARRRAPVRRRAAPRKARTPAVPKGYHTVTPSLVFKDCGAVIAFWEKAFGAKELMRMPGPGGKGIWHAEVKVGDSIVFLNDEMPAGGIRATTPENPSSTGLFLYVKDCDAVFERAVGAGATVTMPLQDMFWGDRFGRVVDPFGFGWGIATRVRNLSAKEMQQAVARATAAAARDGAGTPATT
jgi:PhnB protein